MGANKRRLAHERSRLSIAASDRADVEFPGGVSKPNTAQQRSEHDVLPELVNPDMADSPHRLRDLENDVVRFRRKVIWTTAISAEMALVWWYFLGR
jgi:hypothetical protein